MVENLVLNLEALLVAKLAQLMAEMMVGKSDIYLVVMLEQMKVVVTVVLKVL